MHQDGEPGTAGCGKSSWRCNARACTYQSTQNVIFVFVTHRSWEEQRPQRLSTGAELSQVDEAWGALHYSPTPILYANTESETCGTKYNTWKCICDHSIKAK